MVLIQHVARPNFNKVDPFLTLNILHPRRPLNENQNKSAVSDWGFRLDSEWYQTGNRLVSDWYKPCTCRDMPASYCTETWLLELMPAEPLCLSLFLFLSSLYEKSVLFLMELDVDDRYMPGTPSWLI